MQLVRRRYFIDKSAGRVHFSLLRGGKMSTIMCCTGGDFSDSAATPLCAKRTLKQYFPFLPFTITIRIAKIKLVISQTH